MICWCRGKIGIPCAAAAVHFEYKTTGHVTSKWRAEGCFHRVDMWQTTAADTGNTDRRDRQANTDTDRDRQRDRQTHRDRDTHTQTHRERSGSHAVSRRHQLLSSLLVLTGQ